MSQVTVLDKDKLSSWDNFIASHHSGTLYHTSSWRKVIEDVYGHRPCYLTLEDSNGNITAGLPLFIVRSELTGNRISTLPCAQYCDPLLSNQDEYKKFIDYVLRLMEKEKHKYYELKTSRLHGNKIKYIGKELENYSTYILDLSSPLESIRKSFHKSCVQRAIKKSERSGLNLVVARSADDIKPFYQLYLSMRKTQGLLPQPYKFFETMWEILSKDDHINIFYAEYKKRIISAVLLLKYKTTVIYEYGATISDSVRLHPSHFLLWKSIELAKSQGYKIFDFGRTADDNKSLSTFKSRWGTKREGLQYYYIPDLAGPSTLRNKSLVKGIMHYTIRSMPKSLCQVMGNAIYKHLV